MKKVEEHKDWWLGENRQHFKGQETLIKLSFPRCMIRYKLEDAYFTDFDQWKDQIAEIQWIDGEQPSKKEQEKIITEGWNFLAIEEQILEEDMTDIEIDQALENEDYY